MLNHPRATHIDTTGGTTDSLVIVADTMETYQQIPQRLIASGNVYMNRSDVTSEAVMVFFIQNSTVLSFEGLRLFGKRNRAES